MLCKESMATAPLLVVLYDRVFLFDSWRDAVRSRWKFYAGLAVAWIVLAAVLLSNPRGDVAGFSSGVPVWTYLLNQAALIVEYVRLAVWPRALVAFYGWPQPLSLADVWPQAAVIVGLLVATASRSCARRWSGLPVHGSSLRWRRRRASCPSPLRLVPNGGCICRSLPC